MQQDSFSYNSFVSLETYRFQEVEKKLFELSLIIIRNITSVFIWTQQISGGKQ